MDQKQIKEFIAKRVPEGYSLSKIQDMLKEQNVNITFMELRLLASEIEENIWKNREPEETKKPGPESAELSTESDRELPAGDGEEEETPLSEEPEEKGKGKGGITGKTVVELSKIVRPGAVASGTVKFGSGVTAEWILDQTGRLGLDKPTGKPTEQDIREFQMELQKLFA
ncbi:MAG: hypothetical protein BWY31_02071 [Lentisphaerae bacterium ADurb.Bin242]|nr:MAG: hypothetical protein BWY31_02071 [Lentisphaerae bacterium ADurb.Bin242]